MSCRRISELGGPSFRDMFQKRKHGKFLEATWKRWVKCVWSRQQSSVSNTTSCFPNVWRSVQNCSKWLPRLFSLMSNPCYRWTWCDLAKYRKSMSLRPQALNSKFVKDCCILPSKTASLFLMRLLLRSSRHKFGKVDSDCPSSSALEWSCIRVMLLHDRSNPVNSLNLWIAGARIVRPSHPMLLYCIHKPVRCWK